MTETGPIHPDRFERLTIVAFDPRGDLVVGLCASAYPGRRIADLSISVAAGGVQRSFHTSRRAPDGPVSMRVDEPGLGWRAMVGFTADDGDAVMLPPRRSGPGAVPGHDSSTEAQWGTAAVELDVDGLGPLDGRRELRALHRRTWGVEPIDPVRPGAPDHTLPQQLWWLAALDGADPTDGDGAGADAGVVAGAGALITTGEEDAHGQSRLDGGGARLRPTWAPGGRQLLAGALERRDGPTIQLEPVARFAMRGLGFVSPTWPHGIWHDEIAIGTEEWSLGVDEPDDVHHLHHGCVVRDPDGGRTGWVETLALGPHEPSGLRGFTDGFS